MCSAVCSSASHSQCAMSNTSSFSCFFLFTSITVHYDNVLNVDGKGKLEVDFVFYEILDGIRQKNNN